MARELRIAYVGTYTGEGSRGIEIIFIDTGTGAMERISESDEVPNPSFLALDAAAGVLYAAVEVDDFDGRHEGAVAAFSLTDGGRALALRSLAGSGGTGPCHLALDRERSHVAVANYGSGSVSVLETRSHGELGARTAWVQHSGSGAHPERQEGPHAHSVTYSPGGGSLIVADLGTDSVNVYAYDPAAGTLALHEQIPVVAGSGPRHAAFHPSGSLCYISHELSSEVAIFSWNEVSQTLRHTGTFSTRPFAASTDLPVNTVADIHLSAAGRQVYCSNRGDDTITMFSADQSGRSLRYEGAVPSGGRTPRNFAMIEGTDLLIAANQDSDNLVSFRIDAATGMLSATGKTLSLSRPVCVVPAPPGQRE